MFSVIRLTLTVVFLCRLGADTAIVNNPSSATETGGTGTSQYRSWPDSLRPGSTTVSDSTIRYKIATGANTYTAVELATIRAVMDQIEIDSGNCIKFEQVPDSYLAGPWLNIRPRGIAATPEKACRGSPGFQPHAQHNTTGQLLVLFSSANDNAGTTSVGACLDDQRDAMRLIVNSIGLLSEWRHSKRETFMRFPRNRNRLVDPDYQEFMPFGPTALYATTNAIDTDASTFDSQSITMISPARYAATVDRPTFRLAADLPDVPAEARLSIGDCNIIQNLLFSGRCISPANVKNCESIDPFNNEFAEVEFYPTNKISRPVQCQQVPAISPANPLVLGELLVSGLPVVALTGATAISMTARTATYAAYLNQLGVKTTLFLRTGGIQTPASARTQCTAANLAAGCQYAVRFELTKQPDANGMASFQNQNVIINFSQNGAVIQSLTAILTINCAPVFRKLTANVGPNPLLTAETVYAYPDEIQVVSLPAGYKMASQIVRANNAGQLAQHVVNYNIPMGVGEKTFGVAASQVEVPKKVFVNCNTGAGTVGNSNQAANQRLAATTVIGVVEAVDPEDDEISYYAFSTDPRVAGTANADVPPVVLQTSALSATGELHTVSKDGVISVSGFADPVEAATIVGDNAANPVVGVGASPGGSPNAGLHSGSAPIAPAIARDVFIVAVDQRGASSVLQARYYFACGEPVTAGLTP